MAEDLGWEIRLYSNTWPNPYWVQEDILPSYKAFNFTKVLNDAGSASITFDINSLTPLNLSVLSRDAIITFCKPSRYGVGVGVPLGSDICFAMLPEITDHNIVPPNNHEITFTGPGYGAILDRSITLPAGYSLASTSPDTRPIFTGKAIDAWENFRAEASARNASAILAPPYPTFGGSIMSVDSANVAWNPILNTFLTYTIRSGTGLLDLLKWAREFGGFNFCVDFQGRSPTIQGYTMIYQTYRTDVSGKVGLHLGRHVINASRTTLRESTMSHLYSSQTALLESRVEAVNSSTLTNLGKREFYWTGAIDYSYNNALSLANTIAGGKRAETLTTVLEIAPNVDFVAFRDYDVFDLITYDNPELQIRGQYMVMGIAVKVQESTETQEILLETPIQTFQRRVYEEQNRDEQRFKFNSRILR